MFRKPALIPVFLVIAIACAAAEGTSAGRTGLSASEIVDRNVTARGGLQAWRAVKTMSLAGKLGAGGNQRSTLPVPNPGPSTATGMRQARKYNEQMYPQRPVEEVQLPFVMELQRPRKMRFELQFNGQTAVQVYDGANGWKLRPFLGRKVVEPYTADETKTASMQADLDGPLMDYAVKGTRIELVGSEKVEDRDNYKLKLTMKNGQAIHVWIDAETFLETKIEGQPRRMDGFDHPVEVYFRDYRAVNGLQIPYVLETKVLPATHTSPGFKDPPVPAEKIVIDRVVLNPQFEEAVFTKPELGLASSAKK